MKAQLINIEEALELLPVGKNCGMCGAAPVHLILAIHVYSRWSASEKKGQLAVSA